MPLTSYPPRPIVSLLLAALLSFAGNARPSSEPKLLKPDTNILFLGDSITQAGTYIAYLEAYLWTQFPERDYRLINLGLGSETASGLSEPDHPFPRPCIHDRLDRALSEAQPDLTFICYGMNDGIYYPPSPDRFQAYVDGMMRLIGKVRATGSAVVLLTPPPFDAATKRLRGGSLLDLGAPEYSYRTPYIRYNEALQAYANWVLSLGPSHGVAMTIDIHTPVLESIEEQRAANPDYRYGDGIHPDETSHYVIAKAILTAVEAPGLDEFPSATELSAKTSPIGRALSKVLDRHQLLSLAWREHVGHGKPKKENALPLSEARKQAKLLEEEIRATLEQ